MRMQFEKNLIGLRELRGARHSESWMAGCSRYASAEKFLSAVKRDGHSRLRPPTSNITGARRASALMALLGHTLRRT